MGEEIEGFLRGKVRREWGQRTTAPPPPSPSAPPRTNRSYVHAYGTQRSMFDSAVYIP